MTCLSDGRRIQIIAETGLDVMLLGNIELIIIFSSHWDTRKTRDVRAILFEPIYFPLESNSKRQAGTDGGSSHEDDVLHGAAGVTSQ